MGQGSDAVPRFNRRIIIRGAKQRGGRDPYENSSTPGRDRSRMVPIIAQFPISSSLLCSMDERRAGLEKSFEKMRERTYFCSVYVIFLKEIPSTFLSSRSWLLESQVFA